MTCQQIADFLMDYLNGDLPRTQGAVFEEHLSICPECVAYVQSYKITLQASRLAVDRGRDRPADEVPEELVRAVLAARSIRP